MTGERAHVTKVYGAPGSGKTSTLLDFARTERDEHSTTANDLLFLTFSKSAQKDALEAIRDVYPDVDREDLEKRVRTLHSAAMYACIRDGLLDLRHPSDSKEAGELLIETGNDDHAEYFEYFFHRHFPHLEYDSDAKDPMGELRNARETDVGAEGNRLFAIYNYLRSTNRPLEEHYEAPFNVDLPPQEVLEVLRRWESFKSEHGLIQHADYVERATANCCPSPGKVLLVDEFQDLSPLEYGLYEAWRDSPGVERVYIAGDVHQAIYGFRGANPSQFRTTHADETIYREKSMRCPEAVINTAVRVATPVPEHDVAGVSARRSGGTVEHRDTHDAAALNHLVREAVAEHDEVFLLARTNRQVGKLAWGLRWGGTPYLGLKPDGYRRWENPTDALLVALRLFDEEKGLPTPLAKLLLEHTVEATARHDAQAKAEADTLSGSDGLFGRQVLSDDYRTWFPECDGARDVVEKLSVKAWRRDLLADAIESGATNHPQHVRIGTIHASKGLEAPCILVFPSYTYRQLERYHNGDEAAERRLYYVAITRAKEAVYVVHEYFDGEEFPPLARDGDALRELKA